MHVQIPLNKCIRRCCAPGLLYCVETKTALAAPLYSSTVRHSARFRANNYTPEITKTKFHWKMPLRVHDGF